MREYVLDRSQLKPVFVRMISFALLTLAVPFLIYIVLSNQMKDVPIVSGSLLFFCFLYFIYNLIHVSVRIHRVKRDWTTFRIIRSASLPAEISLRQHVKPGAALKTMFVTLGYIFGGFLLFILLIIGLILLLNRA